jgi:hypothetical protein
MFTSTSSAYSKTEPRYDYELSGNGGIRRHKHTRYNTACEIVII